MSRPTILLDCDGVLADFCGIFLDLHFSLNGIRKTPEDVTDFSFTSCMTPAHEQRIWRHIDSTPGTVWSLPAYPDAYDSLMDLREMGRVVCVTSPHNGPNWMYERTLWLMELGFSERDIVFAKDKTLVSGDCLIDDSTKNVADWDGRYGFPSTGILLARPWNVSGARRYADWASVLRKIEDLVT